TRRRLRAVRAVSEAEKNAEHSSSPATAQGSQYDRILPPGSIGERSPLDPCQRSVRNCGRQPNSVPFLRLVSIIAHSGSPLPCRAGERLCQEVWGKKPFLQANNYPAVPEMRRFSHHDMPPVAVRPRRVAG